jgi:hypothetical protein
MSEDEYVESTLVCIEITKFQLQSISQWPPPVVATSVQVAELFTFCTRTNALALHNLKLVHFFIFWTREATFILPVHLAV